MTVALPAFWISAVVPGVVPPATPKVPVTLKLPEVLGPKTMAGTETGGGPGSNTGVPDTIDVNCMLRIGAPTAGAASIETAGWVAEAVEIVFAPTAVML